MTRRSLSVALTVAVLMAGTGSARASVQTELAGAADCVSGVLGGNGGSCTFTANPPCAFLAGSVTAQGQYPGFLRACGCN